MNPETKSAIRTLLAGLGGVGVAKGWYDADQLDMAIAAIEALLGTGLMIASLVWGIMAKRAASREAQQVAAKVLEVHTPEAITKGNL